MLYIAEVPSGDQEGCGALWELSCGWDPSVKMRLVWLNVAASALPEHWLQETFFFLALFWKNTRQAVRLAES